MELEFEMKGLPKMTNRMRVHWRLKQKEANKWKLAVFELLKEHPSRPSAPFKKASITYTRHSAMEPDFDGLVSGFKHVQDGLVLAGVIANDTPSVIGQPQFIWKPAKHKAGKITVRVVEKKEAA